jgi:hypothetical protein
LSHLKSITHRYYVKGWVKPDADAGSKFKADPQIIGKTDQKFTARWADSTTTDTEEIAI